MPAGFRKRLAWGSQDSLQIRYSHVAAGRTRVRPRRPMLVAARELIDDVIATVDVKCLASDQTCSVVCQESRGSSYILDADKTSCGCLRFGLVQQRIKFR